MQLSGECEFDEFALKKKKGDKRLYSIFVCFAGPDGDSTKAQ